MKNKKKKVWKWAPLFVFILSLWLPVKTEAAEKSCTLTIPVQVEVSGENIPGGKDYKVTLERAAAHRDREDPHRRGHDYLRPCHLWRGRNVSVPHFPGYGQRRTLQL